MDVFYSIFFYFDTLKSVCKYLSVVQRNFQLVVTSEIINCSDRESFLSFPCLERWTCTTIKTNVSMRAVEVGAKGPFRSISFAATICCSSVHVKLNELKFVD